MSNEILSQEEVDALLNNMSGEPTDGPSDQGSATGITNYNLAQQERIVRGRMATLEIVYDRAARHLRQTFYSMVRKNIEITNEGVKPIKYNEWIKRLPQPASYTVLQLKHLRGNGLFVLEPNLVFATIDALFGGNGIHTRIEGRDFSPTEQEIIGRIVKLLSETFAQAWKPILPVEFIPLRNEIHSQFASIATPSELVLACKLFIEIGTISGGAYLCIPYSSIEPIRNLLTNDLQNDSDRDDGRWNNVLHQHVLDTRATLRFELSRKKISLQQIHEFKIGDIIPLDMSNPPEAIGYCNNVKLLKGTPGIQNNHMSVQITHARKPLFDGEQT